MHKRILSYCSIAFLISCSPNTEEKTSAPQTVALPQTGIVQTLEGCYRMIIFKDTAFLSLTRHNENYRGDLWYKRFEKDANRGTVELTQNEDYLSGWYKFESEAVVSVREIQLKILGDSLAEGFGDVALYGDTVKFKYPRNLEYESKNAFVKTTCIP